MVVAVNANVTPTFTQLGPYCVGDTPDALPTSSTNGVTGTWNAPISTASNGSTTYTFTPNGSNCETSETMNIMVNICTGVNSLNDEDQFSIFPNPAKNILNVVGLENVKQVSLLDVTGKAVYNSTIIENNKLMIDLTNVSKGMYFLQVQTENNIESHKVIKH